MLEIGCCRCWNGWPGIQGQLAESSAAVYMAASGIHRCFNNPIPLIKFYRVRTYTIPCGEKTVRALFSAPALFFGAPCAVPSKQPIQNSACGVLNLSGVPKQMDDEEQHALRNNSATLFRRMGSCRHVPTHAAPFYSTCEAFEVV